jgi:hypothetical protein
MSNIRVFSFNVVLFDGPRYIVFLSFINLAPERQVHILPGSLIQGGSNMTGTDCG